MGSSLKRTKSEYLPMFQSRKRNCLLRLLFSMTSSSVTVTVPAPEATPIMAKFLRNSQPRAPAPTKKSCRSPSFFCMVRPKTAIWASYLRESDQITQDLSRRPMDHNHCPSDASPLEFTPQIATAPFLPTLTLWVHTLLLADRQKVSSQWSQSTAIGKLDGTAGQIRQAKRWNSFQQIFKCSPFPSASTFRFFSLPRLA